MSRCDCTSVIHRLVIQHHGHVGSKKKSIRMPSNVVTAPEYREVAGIPLVAARSYPCRMFGPLNGVRVALVASAVVAALAAALIGEFVVTVVLLAAVFVHGLGWVYLYRKYERPGTGQPADDGV